MISHYSEFRDGDGANIPAAFGWHGIWRASLDLGSMVRKRCLALQCNGWATPRGRLWVANMVSTL